jgi:pimeloyl-ACP methyl ester carboxylesterase
MLFFQLPWIPERLLLSKRAISGFMASRSARELAEAEMTAIQQPGTMKAALNWYRGMPFSNPRETAKLVTVPTLYVWSDNDIALKEKGARLCADYVVADYRFEVLKGASHWLLDEQPEPVADLLLDWLGAHSGA